MSAEEHRQVRNIIRWNRIGCIVVKMSERFHISLVDALDIFYKSNTCRRFHDEKTGLYLYGDNYIVEELVREYQNQLFKSRPASLPHCFSNSTYLRTLKQ